MSELCSLESLQSLHRDLLALSELRLDNVDRLWTQLESRIDDFRRLLEKTPRNEQSRKALATGLAALPHTST
jgi:nuclear pore complex protein Nup205